MRRILFILFIFSTLHSFGQLPPSTTRGAQTAYSIDYNGKFIDLLRIPNDTLDYAETGSLAWIDDVVYIKNVSRWEILTGAFGPNTSFNWSVIQILDDPTNYTDPLVTNDKFLVDNGAGDFAGEDDHIAIYNGATFDFEVPVIGDLLYNADNGIVYKYTASGWIALSKEKLSKGGDADGVPLIAGTNDARIFALKTNNVQRFRILANGDIRFMRYTSSYPSITSDTTNNKPAALSADGTLMRLSYWPGGGSGPGGTQGLQDVITEDPALTIDNTITHTSKALTFDGAQFTRNMSDTIRDAAIKISFAGVDSVNTRASVIYEKAGRTQIGASILASLTTNNLTDTTGFRIQDNDIVGLGIETETGAAFKPIQQDTVTKRIARKLIDVSNNTAQVTGIMNVANGGTGASTLTANNVILGNGTSPVTFVAPGTSGNVLTSNGTTWTSATPAAGIWSRGVLGALASTNIVQLTTTTDTVAVGTVAAITALSGAVNVGGTSRFFGNVGINTAPDASYKLLIGGGGGGTGSALQVNGMTFMNYVAGVGVAPNANIAFGIALSGGTNLVSGSYTATTNSTTYTANNYTAVIGQTTAAGGMTGMTQNISTQTDQSSNQTTALLRGYYATINTKSNSSTPITLMVGYDAFLTGNTGASRTQTFTTVYGYRVQDVGVNYPSGGLLSSGGNYYHFFSDSSIAASYAAGSMWGFYQRKNTTNTIKNKLEGNTLIGAGTQDASAALEIISTTQGVLMPRMTATQASAIASPVNGLIVYVTDTNGTFTSAGFWGYQGGAWAKL